MKTFKCYAVQLMILKLAIREFQFPTRESSRHLLMSALFLAGSSLVFAEVRTPAAERCAYGFCVGDKADLIARRVGLSDRIKFPVDSLCLFDPKHDIWVEVGIDANSGTANSVMISQEPLCPKQQSKPFTTEGSWRLRLGENSEGALLAYGPPIRIDDAVAREKKDPRYRSSFYSSKFGDTVLVYQWPREDLLSMFVYVRRGVVRSIWISAVE